VAACAAVVAAMMISIVAGTAGADGAGPREWTRSLKITLLERLPTAPDVVILGSSRAMRLDPDHIRQMTGRSAFNCSVTSGGIPDAWAFMHLIRECFPGHVPTYLWLIDVEQFRRSSVHPYTLADRRLAQFLPQELVPSESERGGTATGPVPRVTGDAGDRAIFDANGFCRWNRYDHWRSRGWTLRAGLRSSCRKFDAIYPSGFRRVQGVQKTLLRDSIRLLNDWGSRPVIVLTPYHPILLAHISRRGYEVRRRAVRDYMSALRREGFRFTFLDFTRIAAFKGGRRSFYDGTHGDSRLMRQLVRAVVTRCGGTL